MIKDVIKDADQHMDKSVTALNHEFATVRTGRASGSLLEKITVDYYGVQTPLLQIASVSTPEPQMLVVSPYDRSAMSNIERAIQASDLGLNPSNDGIVIRLPFPPLTEERRRELVKLCKQYAEEARVATRNIRRDANDRLKKMEKDGEISQDDLHRGEDEIQKITDGHVGPHRRGVRSQRSRDHGGLNGVTPASNSLVSFFEGDEARELLGHLDTDRIPRHIAVIMDGNGRWAAKRALPRLAGHKAGAKAVREVIAAALELGIEVLTIYSFSSENWSRPADEVGGLMKLFVEVLEREFDNLQERGVRVRVAGRKDDLPSKTRAAFDRVELRTAANDRMTLVVALNYGGRVEIIDAVRSIATDVESGALAPAAIDEDMISARLYTSGLPDPDLVVRTSGEMRISNFLLWQIAYSELYVTDTLWPDFDRTSLLKAITEFQGRTRRFGGS